MSCKVKSDKLSCATQFREFVGQPAHFINSMTHISTSKEYLINCHVLLKHFGLIFIQLQLAKISCKLLIIQVNYEKKESFFCETLCICHF